jgi:hypothetical protein
VVQRCGQRNETVESPPEVERQSEPPPIDPICPAQFGIGRSVGSKNPIPEKMDHCIVAVRVPVMNEVKLLLPPEPRKPVQPRSLDMVFLVEKDVCVKRCRTCDDENDEKIHWEDEVCTCSDHNHRNEEEGRIVAFVSKVRPRYEMIFGIVGVMKINMIAEEPAADWMVA